MSKVKVKLDSLVQEPQRPRTSLEVQQIVNRYLKSDCMQFFRFQLEQKRKELDQAWLFGEPKFYFEEDKNQTDKYRLSFSVVAYSTEPEPLFRIRLSADISGQPYATWRVENLPWRDAPQLLWKHNLNGREVAEYLTTLSYYMGLHESHMAKMTGEHLSKYYGRVMGALPENKPDEVHFSVYVAEDRVHIEIFHDAQCRGNIDVFTNQVIK